MPADQLDKLVKDMDGLNLQVMVNLSGGYGDRLEKGVANAIPFPGGSVPLFGIDKVTNYHVAVPLYVTTFSLVFRGFDGDVYVTRLLTALPGGTVGPVALVMAVCFVLGFFLDALEIIFLVIPIAMPPLLFLGVNPVWLAVLTAINLQTSFLHPPFGFALFFMRGVAPKSISTSDIYWGAVPFICVQIVVLALVWLEPRIVTAIPEYWNGAPIAAPAARPGTH
jgi:TRAP-type mannitol/chloroaromatic compound transport system permease large subunit